MDHSGAPTVDAELIKQYAKTIDYHARRIAARFNCARFDDLQQVGREALLKAPQGYKTDRGASFRTYAELKIHEAMFSAARREARQRKIARVMQTAAEVRDLRSPTELSDLRSWFAQVLCTTSAELLVVDPNDESPEETYAAIEQARQIRDGMVELTPREREYLQLKLSGLSNSEIADRWKRDDTTVSKTGDSARRRLKQILEGAGRELS